MSTLERLGRQARPISWAAILGGALLGGLLGALLGAMVP